MGTMASESPTSPLFTQPFIRAQFIENIKTLRHWPLCGPVTGEFPAQMASNAENISIWWPHHDTKWNASVIVHTQSITQRTYVMVTSLLRQNDVATSFWRNNDVIIKWWNDWVVLWGCISWVVAILSQRTHDAIITSLWRQTTPRRRSTS